MLINRLVEAFSSGTKILFTQFTPTPDILFFHYLLSREKKAWEKNYFLCELYSLSNEPIILAFCSSVLIARLPT